MADLSICRVCLVHLDNEKLVSIFQYDGTIPSQIFAVSGIKIMEFTSYNVPALICESCLKDLKIAIKFRNRCKNSDFYIRNLSYDVEEIHWNDKQIINMTVDDEMDSDKISKEIKYEAVVEEYLESDNEQEEGQEQADLDQIDFDNMIEVDDGGGSKPIESFSIREVRTYKCIYCPQELGSSKSLDYHMKVKHDHNVTEIHICTICDKNFLVEKSMKRHMREVHSMTENTHECPDCKEGFSSGRTLAIHQRKVHEAENDREYMCDTCGKIFSSRRKVRKHISDSHLRKKKQKLETDSSESHGPCSNCGKFFKTKGALVAHEKIHITSSPINYYFCDLCGNKFKHKSPLFTHIKLRHLQKVRFHCPDCPERSWATKYALQSHIKVVHYNIRDYRCEWCGKGFGAKDKLTAHIRIHTGERPFECQYCDKRYTHQTDYIRHVWSHTGKRRHTCQLCKQGYVKKIQLENHRCPWKQ